MIIVTPEAAEQIRESARQAKLENMPLRVAVTRLEDGSLPLCAGI